MTYGDAQRLPNAVIKRTHQWQYQMKTYFFKKAVKGICQQTDSKSPRKTPHKSRLYSLEVSSTRWIVQPSIDTVTKDHLDETQFWNDGRRWETGQLLCRPLAVSLLSNSLRDRSLWIFHPLRGVPSHHFWTTFYNMLTVKGFLYVYAPQGMTHKRIIL